MRKATTIARVTVSLPADLLRDVDRFRRAMGETRSAVIRRSVELLLVARRGWNWYASTSLGT